MPLPVVLHVDDNEDEIFLFRRALNRSGLAWSLESAEGGQAALDYLKDAISGGKQKPDLVLVDLKMPMLNGFHVLEWLREHMPEIPAAVVTSSELAADRDKARDLGATAYLSKGQNFEIVRSEEHTSELQSQSNLVCRLLLE